MRLRGNKVKYAPSTPAMAPLAPIPGILGSSEPTLTNTEAKPAIRPQSI